jgi:hypothetical protein
MTNQIAQFPIPMILKIIMKSRMSGELHVKGDNFEKILTFKSGRLVQARSNLLHERLGEILFLRGKVNHRQLIDINRLIVEKRQPGKIGKLLVENGMISQQDLFLALYHQLKAISISLFPLESGEWYFRERAPGQTNLVIELPEILVAGARQTKNIHYFKNKFTPFLPKAAPIADHLVELLTENEIKLHKALQKFAGAAHSEMIETLKISEEFYWKKIVILYLIDAVHFSSTDEIKSPQKGKDTPAADIIEDIRQLYEKISSTRIDYYELLGINGSSTAADVEKAYTEATRKYHPDQIPASSQPELKKKALVIFGELNKAFKALKKSEKKQNRPDTRTDLPQKDPKRQAEDLFGRAQTLYNQEKYPQASALLDSAIKLDGTQASYYYFQGICQMMSVGLKEQAEENLKKAVEIEPWNADMIYALGAYYESENQQELSERYIQEAMELKKRSALDFLTKKRK